MKRRPPSRRPSGPRPSLPPPVELDIVGHIHDGRGLARYQGKAVFVSGALNGERVRVRWTKNQSKFAEASTLEVLEPSEYRITPRCQHFGRCGGCQLQYVNHHQQALLKQESVLNQLARAKVPPPRQLLPVLYANPWEYRARARLGVLFDRAGEVTLGFRRLGDKQLVQLSECPILRPELSSLIPELRHWLQHYQVRAVSHIELLYTTSGVAIVLRHISPVPAEALSWLGQWLVGKNCQLWLSPDNQTLTSIDGEPQSPRLTYTLEGSKVKLHFHPLDFTQVNPEINVAMVDQAMQLMAPGPEEHIVDLFCGIGNFSLPLAQRAQRVTAVEAVDRMVARGRENAQSNGVGNVTFLACDLEQHSLVQLEKSNGPFDAILLDPPRAGALLACQQMAETQVKRVLYISCNPATLARDAATLCEQGFVLDNLGILEMFPHTAHVETMALFTRP